MMVVKSLFENLAISSLLRQTNYLDPGSGSFIIQLILAALLGSLFIIKSYWQRIIKFFRKRSNKEDQNLQE
jgi:hypothetical protein